jgi:hypothetical protein
VKYVKTLARMVHNSDRSAEQLSKIVESLNNQSRAGNERQDELIKGLNNQSPAVNERLDELIKALNNQSRAVNDERLDNVNERLDKLNENQKLQLSIGESRQHFPLTLDKKTQILDETTQDALQLICVGTGRCGTKSITHMIEWLFRQAGDGRTVMHEYCTREFHQAFCDFAESADTQHLAEIRRLIDECPYDCIVGNGYATILPLFAERFGHEVKIVHVRRADRDACIKDLVKLFFERRGGCQAYGCVSLWRDDTGGPLVHG